MLGVFSILLSIFTMSHSRLMGNTRIFIFKNVITRAIGHYFKLLKYMYHTTSM